MGHQGRFVVMWALLAFVPVGAGAMPLDRGARVGDQLVEPTVCVPPGVPPFSAWQAVKAVPALISDTAGRPVLAVLVLYEARGQQIDTFWIPPILLSVDPNPDDPAAPGLRDPGALNAVGAVLEAPKQTCEWVRMVPTAPAPSLPVPQGEDEKETRR